MTQPLDEELTSYMDVASEAFRIALLFGQDEVDQLVTHLVVLSDTSEDFLSAAVEYLKEYIDGGGRC